MRGGKARVQVGFVVCEDAVVELRVVEGLELVRGSPGDEEAVFGVMYSFQGVEAGLEDGMPVFLIFV